MCYSNGCFGLLEISWYPQIAYSNICSNQLRNCNSDKIEALTPRRSISPSKWVNGKPQKPALRSFTPED
uniref:Uncharacterized protein n=1 Tax=Quercus lobata TaxID=97700 RepID=A0A7N2R5S2_QUELO